MELTGKLVGLRFTADEPFCFQALPYTQEELTEKRHDFELTPGRDVILCVDYRQNGIGSNSCGPELAPQYRFDETEFHFNLDIFPFSK